MMNFKDNLHPRLQDTPFADRLHATGEHYDDADAWGDFLAANGLGLCEACELYIEKDLLIDDQGFCICKECKKTEVSNGIR